VSTFNYKQVIVFRSDLRLSKGKAVVQAGHAAVSAAEQSRSSHKKWFKNWLSEGQCKIAVEVDDEGEMHNLEMQANKVGLPCALIVDRGLTEIPPGTVTCLGIGPGPSETIDKLTHTLPLL
jgi:PTH2 family peptidyl-tRNA hydrolase